MVFDIKVTGYEAVAADTAEEALDKFNEMMQNGYKVSDLRWKVIAVDGGNDDTD